jgi:hypothetical protein
MAVISNRQLFKRYAMKNYFERRISFNGMFRKGPENVLRSFRRSIKKPAVKTAGGM